MLVTTDKHTHAHTVLTLKQLIHSSHSGAPWLGLELGFGFGLGFGLGFGFGFGLAIGLGLGLGLG